MAAAADRTPYTNLEIILLAIVFSLIVVCIVAWSTEPLPVFVRVVGSPGVIYQCQPQPGSDFLICREFSHDDH